MNALTHTQEFAVVAEPVTEWLVLRCSPARTMALAAALRDRGAWTPTWQVSRECKRSGKRIKVTEACVPGMVFIPSIWRDDIPAVPMLPWWPMFNPDRTLTRVPDRQLGPLRKIADKPLVPASQLPRAGERWKVIGGPYEGYTVRVLHCTQRYATLAVEGEVSPFAQNLQLPPSLLQETMIEDEQPKRAQRRRNVAKYLGRQ